MPGRRRGEHRLAGPDLDAGAVGSHQRVDICGERLRALTEQTDGAGRLLRATIESDTQAVADHHRHRGVIGGKDRLQTKAEPVAVEGKIRVQVAARQPHLGLHRAGALESGCSFPIHAVTSSLDSSDCGGQPESRDSST